MMILKIKNIILIYFKIKIILKITITVNFVILYIKKDKNDFFKKIILIYF